MASTGEPFGLFWDSDGGDRTYSAGSFESWLKKFFTSGVFNGDLQVQVSSGMTLVVGSGYTNVDGKVKFWNANFNVTLDAANSTYPRIDTVVIRRDNVNRQITCEKVTGQYSGDTPQPTAPTRNGEIYELVLAQILVPAGATEVLASNITDTRPNTSLCGYITGTVEELDFSAFTAQFEAYFAEFKATKVADFNAWELAQEAAYDAWFDLVKAQQIADKASWDQWYADLQEELHNLPPDTAEYLQIQIDEIRDNGTTGSIFHVTTTNTELEGKTLTVSCGTEVRTATFDSNLECTVIGFKSVGNVTFTSTDGIQTATKVLNIDYYSKYEVPIAFWSATVNIQGDDNLKGATVTVKDSDNTTVATIVLNVITGQGVFNAQKADTYTFNYTFSGTNYSEELVVDEETTYSLELSAGFSWTTWVDTASQLDSTDYASLSEVLADEKALRELFLEHACVDYMAELTSSNEALETVINNDLCAKWINLSDYALDYLYANEVIADLMDEADKYGYGEWVITDDTTTPPTWGAKGNVPVMTSNTAPYGTASASTADSTNVAYKVFDGDYATYWGATAKTNSYITYTFANPVCVTKVKMKSRWDDTYSRVKDYKVQGSNDGSNFEDLGSYTYPNEDIEQDVSVSNTNYYLHYRVYVSNNYATESNRYIHITSLQFYGRELKVSVPTMTSNTAPYGVASASTYYSGSTAYYPWKAFDNVTATNSDGWLSRAEKNGAWLKYNFEKDVVPKLIYAKVGVQGVSGLPASGTITLTDDGNNEIASESFTSSSAALYLSTDTPHITKGVKITFSNVGSSKENYVGIQNAQFYCFDYSEKEFEVGTTKKWLYDHGVEVTPLTYANTGTNTVAENKGSEIFLNGGSGSVQSTGAMAYVGKMDLTPYSLMRVKYDGELDGTASGGYKLYADLVVSSLDTPSYNWSTSVVALLDVKSTDTNIPNNISLNISSISGNNNPAIIAFRSNDWYNRKSDIEEWWLE